MDIILNMQHYPEKTTSSGTLTIILMWVLFAVIWFLPANSSALIGLKEGDVPKQIILDDLDGTTVDITRFFGKKPVIIVFWELTTDKSFLNYSLDELRFLNVFYEKYHEKNGLEIFGIYTPEEENNIPLDESTAVESLIKVNKIKFPILIDRGFEMFREYGVIALPSTIMVDKTGKIKFIYPSFPLVAQPLFSEKIEELIGIAKIAHKKEDVKTKGPDSQSTRLYRYSLQMYKRGLLEQALSPLKKSLDMDPNFTWSHNLMGVILWKRGNFEDAVKEFNMAIKLDKTNAPAHFNYGLLLFENEKLDEAKQYFETAVTLDNTMAEAHYILGLLYKKTGRAGDALKELKISLALFEKRKTRATIYESSTFHGISTLYILSELYSNRKNQKKALEMLQKAVRITLGLEDRSDTEHIDRSKDLMIYE